VAPGTVGTFDVQLSWVVLADGHAVEYNDFDLVNGSITVTGQPSISIADTTIVEGDNGTADAVFTVTLSAASTETITVDYSTADATAVAGADYQAQNARLTFAPGETTQTIVVPVIGDTLDEIDEAFSVELSGATNAGISDNQAQATITDNDDAPELMIGDVTLDPEGDSGTSNVGFTVTLSAASGKTITVDYATSDGTAIAGDDFQTRSGQITFQPGQTAKTVIVPVIADTLDEDPERFFMSLDTAVNAEIADGEGEGLITDDDDAPTLSVDDVEVVEGNGGTTTAQFTVSLSEASGRVVTVDYATADGSATADVDYLPASGQLTFQPGQTTRTIDVAVVGDVSSEDDEDYFVNLSGPVHATIADGQGLGSIIDEEGKPSISISDVTVDEGDSGATTAVFTVDLSIAAGTTVTVDYATADAAAVAGNDYQATSGTLTFLPGETSHTIEVSVIGDTLHEADEDFSVDLSDAAAGVIVDGQATGTIANDDAAPTLSISDVTLDEGDSGTTDAVFTVSLSGITSQTITVDYATADGSALAAEDYQTTSGQLTFQPGQTTQTISVPVDGDAKFEPDEIFTVVLDNASGIGILDDTGQATVANDDQQPEISIVDGAVFEGDTGTRNLIFTVSLTRASFEPVIVDYVTAGDTATEGDDYQAASGSVVFAPGDPLTKEILVAVNGDTVDEGDETLTVALSNADGGTLSASEAVGTVQNDDGNNASLSGFVYIDGNDDSLRGADEVGLPGVTITLTGTDSHGDPVELTTMTAADGSYTFTGLGAGTYEITQTQPESTIDGTDTIGTPGGTAGEDEFTEIVLTGDDTGTEHNFGELGFRSEFVSRRMWLASTPQPNSEAYSLILRELIARGEELAGNAEQAELIRGAAGEGGVIVQQDGDAVVVTGTVLNDTFEFATDASGHTVTVNGEVHQFDTAAVKSITFDGAGGNDTAQLTGSADDDRAELRPASAKLEGPDFTVDVNAVDHIMLESGGGQDEADMFDSAGDDTLEAEANTARLFSDEFLNEVFDFHTVRAGSSLGGDDTVDRAAVIDFILVQEGSWAA